MSTRVMLAPVWAREASEGGYGRSCRRVACMSSRACVGRQVMQDQGLAVREYPEVARIGAAVPRDAPGGVRVRERAARDRPQQERRRHPDPAGPRDVGAGREGGRRRCSRRGTTDRRGHVAASRLAGACAAGRAARPHVQASPLGAGSLIPCKMLPTKTIDASAFLGDMQRQEHAGIAHRAGREHGSIWLAP
jgi:hypothetical protein